MKLTLHSKVYLVIVSLALVLGASMYWLTQNSLKSGLLERASQTTLAQLDELARAAESYHLEQGNWHSIQRHPDTWKRMRRGINSEQNETRPRPKARPDRAAKDFHGRRPPPPRHRQPPRPRLEPRGAPIDGGLNVVLLDTDKKLIAGHVKKGAQLATRPLHNKQKLIGYLAIPSHQQLTDALDLEFQRQQLQAFLPIIGLICALLIIISLPLARRLTAPIIDLQKKTRQLTEGKFNVHSDYDSSDELGDLTRDFNRLAETLESNENMRRQWVADISHELRTPIAVIKGHIEAIQDGVRPSTPQAWDKIHAKTEQLNRLVNDLHQLSLSDSGSLKYYKSQFPVAEFLQEFCDTFSAQVNQSGKVFIVDIVLPESLEIYADPGRLTQLLSNLLENSTKYTDAPGTIQLHARSTIKNNLQQLTINIEDTAPGVGPQELKHLFERLYRVESSRNRTTGGAGLGLSLCLGIVNSHNGSIHASPSTLGGLKVSLTLDLCLEVS